MFSKGKFVDFGLGVFNGDCGIIKDIDDDAETVTVLFDDGKMVCYDFIQLDELELAYAVTIPTAALDLLDKLTEYFPLYLWTPILALLYVVMVYRVLKIILSGGE